MTASHLPALAPVAPQPRAGRGWHGFTTAPNSIATSLSGAWLLAIHPDREVPEHRAVALSEAYPAAVVAHATQAAAAVRWAASQREPGSAVVHLRGIDRYTRGWPGHRVTVRMSAVPGTTTVAWTSRDDVDGQHLAETLGVANYVGERETANPAVRGDERSFAAWFQSRYDACWEPWMERGVAVMAAGGRALDQTSVLAETMHVKPSTAGAKHRQLCRILGGEVGGIAAVREHEATVVLARIARERPLRVRPETPRSLQRAAAALRQDQRLAREAAIDHEAAATLIEVSVETDLVHLLAQHGPGRPPARAWTAYREIAIRRIATARAPGSAAQHVLARQIEAGVASSIEAVHDALDDRERSPDVGVITPRATAG